MLAVVLASVGFGVLLTLLAQCLWIKRRFGSLPKLPIPTKQQTESFQLPKELLKLIGDPEVRTKKQSCLFLNLIFQFLFREIKDTKFVRRWVVRKLNAEFAELLQTTSGKLLDRISVRDFNFGSTFPIVHTAAVKHVQMSEDEQCIEELDMALDIEYRGGFHLAVDADLVFGKSAYLSVRVMELKGCLRLQLSRHPYTHWSLAFYEEPTMDFSVESRFEGRPIPQITSLIVNQIRRSIRKKHTLPNYKMRFKPFFLPPEPALPARDLFFRGSLVGQGGLEVTVIECSRLLKPPPDSLLYCTVSLGSLTWLESIRVRKTFITHDVEIIRQAGQPIGMLFKEDFLLERYESVVVIESVSGDSPAAYVDIRKNDILVAVGGQKVTSQKQAAKLLKNAGERIMVRLERAVLNKNADNADLRFDEDFISVKDGEVPGKEGTAAKSQEEDFVNISVRPVNGETKSLQGSPPREQSPYKRPSVTSFLRRRTRSSVGVGRGAGDSPQSSPESRRRTVGTPPEQKDRTRDPLSRSPLTSPKKQSMLKSDKTLSNSDTQINILGKSGLSSASLDDAGRFEDDVDSDSDLDDETEMRRTALVAACQDPLWNEKFRFEVEEGQRYLNVCVWCKIPEKLDRNEKLVKAEKDMLLGYVSLPLCDVALDCLMTLQGDSQRTVHLSPMETKAGASRAKLPSLGGHPVFEPTLCYGDITLGFVHTPYRVGMEGRKRLTKHPSAPTFTFTQHPNHPGEDNSSNKLDEGQHTFILTQFHTATYCGFCGKKIWLKTAFQCHLCHMICHKKCTEKCQAQTLCRKDGVRRRSQPDVLYKTPAAAVEADKKKSGDENVSRTSGILSKFRKDSTGKRGRSSSPAADRTVISGNQIRVDRSPFFIRRRNSAPDDNDSDCSSGGGGLLTVESMPRTRSTTSLQNLVSQNARPTLTSDELKNVEKQGESSSEEGELTVSQTGSITKRHNVDEMVVTAAKQMGRELFSHLKLEERKEKLDAMVSKLQQEIDVESEHRAELSRAEQESVDPTQKRFLLSKISKADEKIQALMVLMLHYCAGLQNCMDLEEEQRQLLDENMENEKKKELGTGAANGDDSKHIIEGVNSDFPDIPQGYIHGGSDELDYVGDLESSSEFDMDVRF